jgi:cytochrome b
MSGSISHEKAMTESATQAATEIHRIRIWDLPTRLFHWLLAICIVALVVTAKMGGNAMNWHLLLGQVVLALLIFRILWGLVGGYWSRFGSFILPAAMSRYIAALDHAGSRGHNPLGSLSVIAMLIVLMAQIASGLMSDDEIAFSGPLTRFVSGELIPRPPTTTPTGAST